MEDGHRSIELQRDPIGRARTVIDEIGPVTRETDADGVLTAIVDHRHRIDIELDPNGDPTGFRLDGSPSVPVPEPEAMQRDEQGRITVDEDGRRFGYDSAGRLASVAVGSNTTTYDYDDRGLLATEHGADGVRVHHHGPAGEIVALSEADGSEITFLYDLQGRRVAEQRTEGTQRDYHWDDFGRLVRFVETDAHGNRRERVIDRDPLGRPMLIDDTPIRWADPTGLELLGIGDSRYARADVRIRELTDEDDRWSRRVGDDPWGTDRGTGVRVGHRGHVAVDDLVLMGARVYDPRSRSFLTRDPLPSVPGQVSFAGLYQYAWCDPVNNLDPTGRKPLSDEDYAAWKEQNDRNVFQKGWDSTKGWVKDNWKSVAVTAGAVIVGGVLTVATAGLAGPVLTGVLIGAGVGFGAGVVDTKVNGGT